MELGYEQYGLRPPGEVLDYIVGLVDGVIGWLAYIGFRTVQAGRVDKSIVDEVVREAYGLVLQELEHFLELRPLARERYMAILKAVAVLENATWTNIYYYVQARVGRVPKPTFNTLLKNLVDAGFLEKKNGEYTIADPILRRALMEPGIH